MNTAVIYDSHMKYDGTQYYSAASSVLTIGSYGDKDTPAFGQNKLTLFDTFPKKKFDVIAGDVIEIDMVNSKRSGIDAMLSSGNVVGGLSASHENVETQKIKLVQFKVSESNMIEVVNGSPKHRRHFSERGRDGRVVHEIFVISSWREAELLTSPLGFVVTSTSDGFNFAMNGRVGSGTGEVITVKAGTTGFYSLMRPKWKRGKDGAADTVKDFEIDEWGAA